MYRWARLLSHGDESEVELDPNGAKYIPMFQIESLESRVPPSDVQFSRALDDFTLQRMNLRRTLTWPPHFSSSENR